MVRLGSSATPSPMRKPLHCWLLRRHLNLGALRRRRTILCPSPLFGRRRRGTQGLFTTKLSSISTEAQSVRRRHKYGAPRCRPLWHIRAIGGSRRAAHTKGCESSRNGAFKVLLTYLNDLSACKCPMPRSDAGGLCTRAIVEPVSHDAFEVFRRIGNGLVRTT